MALTVSLRHYYWKRHSEGVQVTSKVLILLCELVDEDRLLAVSLYESSPSCSRLHPTRGEALLLERVISALGSVPSGMSILVSLASRLIGTKDIEARAQVS